MTTETQWKLTYILVAVVAALSAVYLAHVNRFGDSGCVLLMAANAIWVSAANAFSLSKISQDTRRE